MMSISIPPQVGGHAGYRFSSQLAVFASYSYIAGDVSWRASFAVGGPDSHFNGDANSHLVTANVSYAPWQSDDTALDITVGLGAAVNRLQSVDEIVAVKDFISPTAQKSAPPPGSASASGTMSRPGSNSARIPPSPIMAVFAPSTTGPASSREKHRSVVMASIRPGAFPSPVPSG